MHDVALYVNARCGRFLLVYERNGPLLQHVRIDLCRPEALASGCFFGGKIMTVDAPTSVSLLGSHRAPAAQRAWMRRHRNILLAPVVIAGGILAWAVIVRVGGYPAFVLPAPSLVWSRFLVVLMDGSLLRHAAVTLVEIALGLALGVGSALILGYILGKNRTVERLIAPYIVASQSVPIVAIAPLLVIWFGSGLASKVLVCALITFFPTLISAIVGLRGVDRDLRDLMRSLKASRWQTFRMLELPASLPIIFGGLKLSVILAVVGAVVGEFMGASVGLGFLINLGRGVFDTPLMFVAIIALVVIAEGLYLAVSLLERSLLRWQQFE